MVESSIYYLLDNARHVHIISEITTLESILKKTYSYLGIWEVTVKHNPRLLKDMYTYLHCKFVRCFPPVFPQVRTHRLHRVRNSLIVQKTLVSIPLTNKAETSNRNVEHKEWVHGNAYSVPNNTWATQDTHSCRQRPSHEDEINGYSGDSRQSKRAEQGSDDEWEECVTDNADRLEERATKRVKGLV